MQNISKQDQNCARAVRGGSTLIQGLVRILGGILLVVLSQSLAQAGQNVTLAWSPSSGSGVTGYNVYWGGQSESYTNVINVGNTTQGTVIGLTGGATYYFAVTAYNAIGLESDYSGEIGYTVPGTAAGLVTVNIRPGVGRRFIVTVTGQSGHTYEVQANQTFNPNTWTVLGTTTMGSGGSFDYTDTNSTGYLQRFYRAHDTSQ